MLAFGHVGGKKIGDEQFGFPVDADPESCRDALGLADHGIHHVGRNGSAQRQLLDADADCLRPGRNAAEAIGALVRILGQYDV